MTRTATVAVLLCLICSAWTMGEPAKGESEDARSLYLKAAGDGFTVQSPTESVLEYSDYPPFPPEWHKLAKAAREANADRLALARQARTAKAGQWPPGPIVGYLNGTRALANELGDA